MNGSTPERLYALDWLRVAAVIAVFFFHAAHIFDLDPQASVKNRDTSVALSVYVFFADQWMMQAIFLVAGASAWVSLRTRTRSRFLKERASRLLVPFLLGTLFLIPWHGYVSARNHGIFTGSFWAYFPVHFSSIWSALQKPPLPFNSTIFFVTSWHLWFLADLFVFSAFATRWVGKAAPSKLQGRWRVALLGLPVISIKLIFEARFPSHTDWSETLVWLLFYGYGWQFMKDPTLWRDIRAQASGWLVVGLASIGLLALAFSKGLLMRWLEHPAYSGDFLLYQFVAGVNTWAWVLATTGFFLRYLNRDHRYLRYLSPVTLPFYILHQTALLTIGWWVVQAQWDLFAKFAVIAISSLLITMTICEFLIRRSAALQFVFGMRPNLLRDPERG